MTDTKNTVSKDVPWYLPGPPHLRGDVKALLSSWSGIDPANDGIEKHVEDIREEAWKVHPYPCIGGYRFLNLGLQAHPSFAEVVALLKSTGHILLDLGCCVGQDLRSLALAGVPGKQLVGVDLERTFIDIGYRLFRDQDKLGARFLTGDITADDSHDLDSLPGHISIIWTSAFLHLWDFADQVMLCRKILIFMENKPGVRVLGRQVGSHTPGTKVHVTNKSGRMYQHDPATFRNLWAEALGHTGKIDDRGHLASPGHGNWTVKAWFEEDRPSNTPYGSLNNWLAKVSNDSHAAGKPSPDSIQAVSERQIAFLVWEVQRTS